MGLRLAQRCAPSLPPCHHGFPPAHRGKALPHSPHCPTARTAQPWCPAGGRVHGDVWHRPTGAAPVVGMAQRRRPVPVGWVCWGVLGVTAAGAQRWGQGMWGGVLGRAVGSGGAALPVGQQGESWGGKGGRVGWGWGGPGLGGVGSWDLFGAPPGALSGGRGGDCVAEGALLEVGAAVVGGSRAVGRGTSGTPTHTPSCGGRPYSRATPSAGSSRGVSRRRSGGGGEGTGRCQGVRQRSPERDPGTAGGWGGGGRAAFRRAAHRPGERIPAAPRIALPEEGGGGRDAAALRCPLRCHLEAVRGGSAGICRGGGTEPPPPAPPPPTAVTFR